MSECISRWSPSRAIAGRAASQATSSSSIPAWSDASPPLRAQIEPKVRTTPRWTTRVSPNIRVPSAMTSWLPSTVCTAPPAAAASEVSRRTSAITPSPSGPRSRRSPRTHSRASPPDQRDPSSRSPEARSAAVSSARWPWASLVAKTGAVALTPPTVRRVGPSVWLKRERHGDLLHRGQALRARHVLPPRPHPGRGPSADPLDDAVPQRLEGQPARRPGVGRRTGPLPPRRRARLPVGAPLDHRAQPARARGRHLLGRARPDPRRPQLDLRPRRGRPRPGARHRAAPGGLPRPRPRLPARHHRARDRRRRVGRGRDQRLPADHPRPGLRVARPPAPRRPGPVARRPPRGDGGGHEAGLHRGQQRRLPLWLRRLAGGVRRRVRAAVDRDGLARGASRRPSLPHG